MTLLAQTPRAFRIEKLLLPELSNYLASAERVVVANRTRTMSAFTTEWVALQNNKACSAIPLGAAVKRANWVISPIAVVQLSVLCHLVLDGVLFTVFPDRRTPRTIEANCRW